MDIGTNYDPDLGDSLFSTCLGFGTLGGWLFVGIGAIFPFCYTFCFIVLGEGGRKKLGLKNTNHIPE